MHIAWSVASLFQRRVWRDRREMNRWLSRQVSEAWIATNEKREMTEVSDASCRENSRLVVGFRERQTSIR